MNLTYHNSATVLIQDADVKILCDPWLVSGEHYGSWGIYPSYDFKAEEFDDVDFIYISHIHPDHFSIKTLTKLNKQIPVIIYNFPEKFLKNSIENLGFHVIELDNNKPKKLKGDIFINILIADNCNPEICGKLFGCAFLESHYKITPIDTMAVIGNSKETIVNTNDCLFEIAENTAKKIKIQYGNIDMLLVGYAGASAYPQCFNLSKEETEIEAQKKTKKKLESAIEYIKIFNPKYFLPFAGLYTLAGKLHVLNSKRGEPDFDYAYEYLKNNINQTKNKCIALNQKQSFDITTGKSSGNYEKIDLHKKEEYVKNVLSKIKLDYEYEPEPHIEELIKLIPKSYERFNKRRLEIGFSNETVVILKLSEEKLAAISCNGKGYKIISPNEITNYNRYTIIETDNHLLFWLLQGPKKAHWNNAENGSHLQFKRMPNIYERGINYCWNFFYSGEYSDN